MEINHENTSEIICPYCGYELADSFEFSDDSFEINCYDCENTFSVERNIEVTYSTSKAKCKKCDYKFDGFHISKHEWKNGEWFDLPEEKWKYNKIVKCVKCDDEQYIEITKQAYDENK